MERMRTRNESNTLAVETHVAHLPSLRSTPFLQTKPRHYPQHLTLEHPDPDLEQLLGLTLHTHSRSARTPAQRTSSSKGSLCVSDVSLYPPLSPSIDFLVVGATEEQTRLRTLAVWRTQLSATLTPHPLALNSGP